MDRPVSDVGPECRSRNNLAIAFTLTPPQVYRVVPRRRGLALCLRSASFRSHQSPPQINGFSVREHRQSQPTQSSPRQWATFSVKVSARAPCSRSARPPHPSSVGSTPNRSLAHQPSAAAAWPCVNASQRASSTSTPHRSGANRVGGWRGSRAFSRAAQTPGPSAGREDTPRTKGTLGTIGLERGLSSLMSLSSPPPFSRNVDASSRHRLISAPMHSRIDRVV
jgi:hypothetical protein